MRSLSGSSFSPALALLGSAFLAACSDGSVSTLDARPSVSVSVPGELQNNDSIEQENLSPQIRLSNGAAVNMSKNADGSWVGTINVAPGRTYIATIVWVETIDGQDVPLASQTQNLEVSAEGQVTRTDSNGYSTDIDSDSDGSSNLQERSNGTNPLQADSSSVVTPVDDSDSGTATVSEPVVVAAPDPAPEITTATTSDSVSDSVSDTVTDSKPDTAVDSASTPVMADVIVPRIATRSAPVMDGDGVTALGANGELIGEWAAAVQVDNSGAPLFIDQLLSSEDSDEVTGSTRRQWAAMHDGDFLYILVLVDDAGDRHRDSGSSISDDDSIEIFLDGDNSKSLSYDDNDRSHLFPLQLAGEDAQSATAGDVGIALPSALPLSVKFATGPGNGPAGIDTPTARQDVYEIRIGLTSAGINVDDAVGFEIIVNDDDGGDEANAQWSWNLPAGSNADLHQNPSLFGTLVLE